MTQRNRRMFWLLARAHRSVAAACDASLADLGLTITQAGALFCFGEEGLLIGELGEALELAQSAASGLAKRLEEAGLVARTGTSEPLSFGQTAQRWVATWLTWALAGLPGLLALSGRSLADRLSGSRTYEVEFDPAALAAAR